MKTAGKGVEWCSKQSENLPRKGRITQMNHFSNCKRFPLAGSLTRKVCLEWEARTIPERPSTPCLEFTLRMIEKPRKVFEPGVTDKYVDTALPFCYQCVL